MQQYFQNDAERKSVAILGTSLDEFAGDLKAILDAKLKNL
jgi:hypothetical protein